MNLLKIVPEEVKAPLGSAPSEVMDIQCIGHDGRVTQGTRLFYFGGTCTGAKEGTGCNTCTIAETTALVTR